MEEYVSKDEIRRYRELFEDIISIVRKEIKKYGITFTCNLVGSGKRNLVVRHPTKGCDLDYQIFLQKNNKDLSPKEIKDKFRKLFNQHKPKGYSDCEDSTTALTIKKKNKEQKIIVFSYDIVIMKNDNIYPEIIRRNEQQEYIWNELRDMKNFVEKYKEICTPQMHEELRKRYYKKKIDQMNGKTDKKSFQLLNESVNEVLKLFNDK